MIISSNLKETAYEHVKQLIVSGSLAYDTVYSERKISTEIGVSRTPFHSALQQLEQEGYIDILPSRGFALHRMSEQDVIETFEVRSAIEFFCIYTLAEEYKKQTPESIAAIKTLQELLKAQADIFHTTRSIDDFVVYDFEFHSQIVSFNGNHTFDAVFRSHTYKIKNLACRSLAHEGRMENTLKEHQSIIDAVIGGDLNHLCAITMRHFNTPKYMNLQDIM